MDSATRTTRLFEILGWIFCGLLLLVGGVLLVLYFFFASVATFEELTLAEGCPRDITTQTTELLSGGTLRTLAFTVRGYRTDYHSDWPHYEAVAAAVQSGQPLQVWLSTRRETLFDYGDPLPLYALSVEDRGVLWYATTADRKSPAASPILHWGLILTVLGLLSLALALNRLNRKLRPRFEVPPPRTPAQEFHYRVHIQTVALSVLSFVAFAFAILHPDSVKVFAKAWGPDPGHFFVPILILVVGTFLYLPVPLFCRHASRLLTMLAASRTPSANLSALTRMPPLPPEITRTARTSIRFAVLGFAYFTLLCAAWIACAALASCQKTAEVLTDPSHFRTLVVYDKDGYATETSRADELPDTPNAAIAPETVAKIFKQATWTSGDPLWKGGAQGITELDDGTRRRLAISNYGGIFVVLGEPGYYVAEGDSRVALDDAMKDILVNTFIPARKEGRGRSEFRPK
jgi:hypothetical protein